MTPKLSHGITLQVKTGKGGAFVLDGVECFRCPTYQEDKIIDTVGAGDGLSAGVIPGCATPSEIEFCGRKGLHVVKLFPAEVPGGVKGLLFNAHRWNQ